MKSNLKDLWKKFGAISWYWVEERALVEYIADRAKRYGEFYDFGCGDGTLLEQLYITAPELQSNGLDLNIRDAEKRFEIKYDGTPPNIELQEEDLDQLSVPDNSVIFGFVGFTFEYTGAGAVRHVCRTINEDGELLWICHNPQVSNQLASRMNPEYFDDPSEYMEANQLGLINAWKKQIRSWDFNKKQRIHETILSTGMYPIKKGIYLDSSGCYSAIFESFSKEPTENLENGLVLVCDGRLLEGVTPKQSIQLSSEVKAKQNKKIQ